MSKPIGLFAVDGFEVRHRGDTRDAVEVVSYFEQASSARRTSGKWRMTVEVIATFHTPDGDLAGLKRAQEYAGLLNAVHFPEDRPPAAGALRFEGAQVRLDLVPSTHFFVADPNTDPEGARCEDCGKPKADPVHGPRSYPTFDRDGKPIHVTIPESER